MFIQKTRRTWRVSNNAREKRIDYLHIIFPQGQWKTRIERWGDQIWRVKPAGTRFSPSSRFRPLAPASTLYPLLSEPPRWCRDMGIQGLSSRSFGEILVFLVWTLVYDKYILLCTKYSLSIHTEWREGKGRWIIIIIIKSSQHFLFRLSHIKRIPAASMHAFCGLPQWHA